MLKDPEKALKLKEEARRKLKQERLNKRLDRKIDLIQKEEQQSKISIEPAQCLVKSYSQIESNNEPAHSSESKQLSLKIKSSMRKKSSIEYKPYKINNPNKMNIRNTYSAIDSDIRVPDIHEPFELTEKHTYSKLGDRFSETSHLDVKKLNEYIFVEYEY